MKDLKTIVDENRVAHLALPNERKLIIEGARQALRLSLSTTPTAIACRALYDTKRLNRRAALLAGACGGASDPATLAFAKATISETLNPAVSK